jgi:hypothetical protein
VQFQTSLLCFSLKLKLFISLLCRELYALNTGDRTPNGSRHRVLEPQHVCRSEDIATFRKEVQCLAMIFTARHKTAAPQSGNKLVVFLKSQKLRYMEQKQDRQCTLVASSPLCGSMLVDINCINVRRNTTVFSNC